MGGASTKKIRLIPNLKSQQLPLRRGKHCLGFFDSLCSLMPPDTYSPDPAVPGINVKSCSGSLPFSSKSRTLRLSIVVWTTDEVGCTIGAAALTWTDCRVVPTVSCR